MSKKIPFLQMFSALRRWAELAQAVEGWLIVSAAIDKATRSAKIVVEGAGGAGSNLIREAEETLARAYGLSSVKITSAPAAPSQPIPEAPTQTAGRPRLLRPLNLPRRLPRLLNRLRMRLPGRRPFVRPL